jgi:hypothetical protein
MGDLASEAETKEHAGFEYEVSVDAAESRDQLSDNGRIWMMAKWSWKWRSLMGFAIADLEARRLEGAGCSGEQPGFGELELAS